MINNPLCHLCSTSVAWYPRIFTETWYYFSCWWLQVGKTTMLYPQKQCIWKVGSSVCHFSKPTLSNILFHLHHILNFHNFTRNIYKTSECVGSHHGILKIKNLSTFPSSSILSTLRGSWLCYPQWQTQKLMVVLNSFFKVLYISI
jgi:hypothetical protein